MIGCSEKIGSATGQDIRKRGQFTATVTANKALCCEHYILTVRLKDFPRSEPGQFVQVLCPPPDAPCDASGTSKFEIRDITWEPGTLPPRFHDPYLLGSEPFLRRPFSIAGRRDTSSSGCGEIDLIYRVVGKATGRMEALNIGEELSILGPLGNDFPTDTDMRMALLVGGGVGIPPMMYLAEKLCHLGIPAVAFIGAQRADLMPLEITGAIGHGPSGNVREFARYNTPAVVATDDGSLGNKGFVTEALEAYGQQLSPPGSVVFCCGPTPMMRATAQVCARLNLRCYASLEQPMACGMGTCQSCVIKYRPAGTAEWVYKLTCTDGPVFNTTDILW